MKPIIAFLTAILLGAGCGNRVTPPMSASGQIEGKAAADSSVDHFAFSELRDLPQWNALFIFAPYTPVTNIDQTLGFEWPEAAKYPLFADEGVHLAVSFQARMSSVLKSGSAETSIAAPR